MKNVYLDTNAFIKLFLPEEEGKESIERVALLSRQNKILLIISEWVVNESLAVVEKYYRNGVIDGKEAKEIIEVIATNLENAIENLNFKSYAINEKVVIGSRIIITDIHPYASDALHLFVAIASRCNYIITGDQKLINSIQRTGIALIPINILNPNEVSSFIQDNES